MSAPGYEIATTASFLSSLEALDKRHRKAVLKTLDKLHAGNASVHVHKLKGVPYVSFDVVSEGLRIICHREDETLLLLHADLHKPAYDWCRRNHVVRVGRAIRLFRTDVVDGPAEAEGSEASELAIEARKPPEPDILAPPGPLCSFADEVFARFDIGAHAARALRAVPDEYALLDLASHLPPPRAEALLILADQPDELGVAVDRYREALEAATAPTLSEAVRDSQNSAFVWATSPDDEAFRRALEGDFDAWRVFLHPSQRRLVQMRTRGALKITGGPGTGKTIVALHRAKHLAENRPAEESRPILVTVFSAVLARQIEETLAKLCGEGSALRERIVVRSVVGVACDLLANASKPSALITDTASAWEDALQLDAEGRGQSFYESEREQVLARADAWTLEAYLAAPRTGRTHRLDRAGRKRVWAVLAAFDEALRHRGGGDAIALARDARELITSGGVVSPYSAIVCDEVQDLGAAELRLLAALAIDPSTAKIRDDGLTLTGDGYQRIYRAPVSLLACGLETRGRSRLLRLNYRTTESIRRAAVQALGASEPDDLDEGAPVSTSGYRSLRDGPAPEEHTFASPSEEADWIAEQANKPGTLLVLARTRAWLDQLADLLRARALSPRQLGRDDVPAPADTLLLATMHRAKGLEAPRVIIAGRHLVPARFTGGDANDRKRWERQERCLLYVALTRARDWCGGSGISRAGC